MRKTSLTVAVCATLLWAGAALAKPTPGEICAAAKQAATGHKTNRKLTCYAKYTHSGGSFDVATCLAKAEATFAKAFHTAEFTKSGKSRGCTTTGDAAALEGLVDDFVAAVVGALPAVLPTPSATPTQAPTNTPTPTVPSFDLACVRGAILGWPPDAPFAIPTQAFSIGSLVGTMCPMGPDPTAAPPICTGEMQLPATLTQSIVPPGVVVLTGTMLFRVADEPVQVNLSPCAPTITMAVDGDLSCPGGAYDNLSLAITIAPPVNGSDGPEMSVASVFDQNATTANLFSSTSICGIGACDAICCTTDACACALASTDFSALRNLLTSSLRPVLESTLVSLIEPRICANNASSPCPVGTTPDAAGLCRHADGACAPSPALYAAGC